MYEKILVPMDGSPFSEAALPLALELSRRTGAELHLTTVIEGVTEYAFEGWGPAAEKAATEHLEGVVGRIESLTTGTVSYSVRHGIAAEELANEVRESKVDIVVMSSHGRGGMARLWLGSVADRFSRTTDVPVLLVRPDEDAEPVTDFGHDFETLLVPLDGSELSEKALRHATDFGELFDSAYHLTRVASYPIDISSPYLPQTVELNQEIVDEAKKAASAYLEEHAERMRKRGLRVTTSVVVDAQAGHGIVREAEAVGAEVIAMATHGHTGVKRFVLGSATDKVIRGSHVPVLLHRPRED